MNTTIERDAALVGEAIVGDFTPLQSSIFTRVGGIAHGLSRRVQSVSPAEANISYTAPRNRDAAWQMRQRWCDSVGVDARKLAVPYQVHGSGVAIVRSRHAGVGAAPGSRLVAKADAVITADEGVALMTTHADCLPLLLYAPRSRVVSTVHAGWRSTVSGVTRNTLRTMFSVYHVEPDDLLAFIGPAICRTCYEVGGEVERAWNLVDQHDDAGAILKTPERMTFDLVAANKHLLLSEGVPARNIEESGLCTRCNGTIGSRIVVRGSSPVDLARSSPSMGITDIPTMSTVETRILQVQQRIRKACATAGREASDVTLVAVSKTVGRVAIDAAYATGLRDFGENRIQDASAKLVENWPADARRHFIGSLQTNKASVAVRIFDLIHTVDRQSLIDELLKQAIRHDRQVSVLLQVNIAREPQKSGCDPAEADSLIRAIVNAPELDLQGLMTIAPLVENPEDTRPVFAGLRILRDRLQSELSIDLPCLSMGMTNDFEVAIDEGATHIRVGRALFGT